MKKISFDKQSPFIENITDKEGTVHATVKNAAGAGLSRVLSSLGSNRDFAIFTNFRGENSFSQNASTFKKLPKELRTLCGNEKIGGYWLIGHWHECQGLPEGVELQSANDCEKLGGFIEPSTEYSWLFTRPDDVDQDTFFEACFKLTKKYDQDAWVARENGQCTVRSGKTKDIWGSLQVDGKVIEGFLGNSAYMRANYPQWGYSELRKNTKGGISTPMIFMPKEACLVAHPRVGVKIPDGGMWAKQAYVMNGIQWKAALPN